MQASRVAQPISSKPAVWRELQSQSQSHPAALLLIQPSHHAQQTYTDAPRGWWGQESQSLQLEQPVQLGQRTGQRRAWPQQLLWQVPLRGQQGPYRVGSATQGLGERGEQREGRVNVQLFCCSAQPWPHSQPQHSRRSVSLDCFGSLAGSLRGVRAEDGLFLGCTLSPPPVGGILTAAACPCRARYVPLRGTQALQSVPQLRGWGLRPQPKICRSPAPHSRSHPPFLPGAPSGRAICAKSRPAVLP